MDLLLGYTQKDSYQWRYLSILIYSWSSPFIANVGLWSYTQQSSSRTKDHQASPQTDHSSVHSLPTRILYSLFHRVGVRTRPWCIRRALPDLRVFLLFLVQLLFTVLGSGHVHEASGAHRLSNRANPWITSWLGAHHLLFKIPRIYPLWLTLGPGSDTTCKDYGHHLSLHWYDIVHFEPKPSWICSWAIAKRPHTNGDIYPSLYTHDPPHL
jgi:hypothetical protein